MTDAQKGPRRLVVYADFTCVFCYLAEPVLRRLEAEDDVVVAYRPYELNPPALPPPDGPPESVAFYEETLLPLAEELGAELRRPARVPRTRKAHEAAAFAAERDRLAALRAGIQRAHFVEGRDIGRVDVLVEIGAAARLDPQELRVALDVDKFTEPVLEAEAQAEAEGVTGVPTFVGPAGRLVGWHAYEALRELALGRQAGS